MFLVFPPALFSQKEKIEFQHVSYDYNLPHNAINAIYQDRTGFLWIGTKSGLDLFDGYKFFTFRRTNKENTLTNDYVKVIYEDSRNDLWIGTSSGLNKFLRNEQSFVQFKNQKGNRNSLCNNSINSIIEDKIGNLWIATDRGLSRYDRNLNKFFNYYNKNSVSSISSDTIRSMYLDSEGNLWLGLTDLRLDCINIGESFSGNISIDTGILSIRHCYLSRDLKRMDNPGIISKIIRSSDKKYWIGTEGEGLFCFSIDDPGNFVIGNKTILNAKNFKNNEHVKNSLSNNNIRDILQLGNGNIWICTYGGGISVYKNWKPGFEYIQNDPGDILSLSNNYALTLFMDRHENIWAGCATGGLNKYAPKNFDVYKSNPKDKGSLKNDIVTSMLLDSDGILWVGTRDKGLNVLDRKKGTCINYVHNPNDPTSIGNTNVRAICEDKTGRLWIGLYRGLGCFDKKNKKFTSFNDELSKLLSGGLIRAVYCDSKNNLWIGSIFGVIKYNLNDNTFKKYVNDTGNQNSLSASYTWSFLEDRSGNMWIGTVKGVNRFIEKKEIFRRYIIDNEKTRADQIIFNDENLVVSIAQDLDGVIWLATIKGGLHKISLKKNYNPNDPSEDPYELSEFDLPLVNTIGTNGILVDDNNNLWVGSDIGVVKVYPGRLNWRLYDMKDGVTANEFITGSCYKSQTGEFFFGGNAGLLRFFPVDFVEHKVIPSVVLTSLKISNVEKYSGTKSAELKELYLDYTENIITFDFSILDFTDIPKNQYKYKLEGFDKDWIESGNKHEVTYMNLKGGDYIFRVIGCNSDGYCNNEGIAIKIIIHPPIWERWWFYPLIIIMAAGLVFLFVKRRLVRSERQKKVLEEQVKIRTEDLQKANELLENEVVERKQIEQDILKTNNLLLESNSTKDKLFSIISHDLRGPVGNLAGMLKVFKEEKDMEPGFREEFLSSMTNSAESTYGLLENLLDWARTQKDSINLKMENVPLTLIIDEILGFLSGIASKKSISIISHVDENLTAYCDHNTISTVIRNLLSNALKFTPENGKIELSAKEEADKIIVSVQDSGVGMKPEVLKNIFDKVKVISTKGTDGEKGTGLGLLLCMEFVRKNGGTMWGESELGKGTTFHFSISKAKEKPH